MSLYGINIPRWDNRMGMPIWEPRSATIPRTNRMEEGTILLPVIHQRDRVDIIRYLSFPFLAARSHNWVQPYMARQIVSHNPLWRLDYTRCYVNCYEGRSYIETPIFERRNP